MESSLESFSPSSERPTIGYAQSCAVEQLGDQSRKAAKTVQDLSNLLNGENHRRPGQALNPPESIQVSHLDLDLDLEHVTVEE